MDVGRTFSLRGGRVRENCEPPLIRVAGTGIKFNAGGV